MHLVTLGFIFLDLYLNVLYSCTLDMWPDLISSVRITLPAWSHQSWKCSYVEVKRPVQ